MLFPFALTVLGLSLIALTVLYQRNRRAVDARVQSLVRMAARAAAAHPVHRGSVLVEPFAGLLAQLAGADHPAQQLGGGRNRSPKLGGQCSAMASRTSRPTWSVSLSGPMGWP